jgi:carbon storage regulator CsrA
MLVLTRKLQQQIKIGDAITVTVLRVKGSTVRIGVQAPRDVRVIRGELPKGDPGSEETSPALPSPPAAIATDEITAEEPSSTVELTLAEAPAPTADLPKPAHLPLRKIKSRRGAGPLKQMVAACATLAK